MEHHFRRCGVTEAALRLERSVRKGREGAIPFTDTILHLTT